MTLPVMRFPWAADRDPAWLLAREWLVTNGLGGYASGTLLGVGTRRYHGLFIPNLPSPRGRTVMVPRLHEKVQFEGRTIRLGGAEFADGRVEGEWHAHLTEFRLDGQTPVWEFDLGGRRLHKRIVMPYGQNTVYVDYRFEGPGPLRLTLRPHLTFRGHDESLRYPMEWPFTVTMTRGRFEVHPFEGLPPLRIAIRPQRGVYVAEEKCSRNVFHRTEHERGYDHVEELFSPGYFSIELADGEGVALAASTEPWPILDQDPAAVFDAERARQEQCLGAAPAAVREGMAAHLVLAADQFIVLPGSRLEEDAIARASGDQARTVVAGYHWFTDWGRDTMIALEGLTLCTGRYREAGAILRTFGRYVHDGLLPNHFPEGERTAIYNTADATLWYFHALDRYERHTGDVRTVEGLYPVLESIIEHHLQGTRFGIGVDPADGLLRAGAEGLQLTWMDAKVDDWVVTPRRGKPVEIQALWYQALRLMAEWAGRIGRAPDPYTEAADRVATSFNDRFWCERAGYLFDVIDGPSGDDDALRPNQVLALSLRDPVLAPDRWEPVMRAVTDRLLTPYGLRSLDPAHPAYRPRYEGDRRARDAAYHQGLIWAWLIGPYLDAHRRIGGDPAVARRTLAAFEAHLRDAGVGTISEIFDAESPYAPRGCIAQAWSVGEVLRTWLATETAHAVAAASGERSERWPVQRR